jgi:hypothetical protein
MSTLPSTIVLSISSSSGTSVIVTPSSMNMPAVNSQISTIVALPSDTAITSSYAATASIATTASYASSVEYSNISAKPTLFSGSAQVTYSGISGIPADLFKTGSHSTTDITEGSKLFYTDARVKTKLNTEGVISSSAQVIQQSPDIFRTGSHTTTDITEGAKLFYTDARVKTKLNAEGVKSGSIIYSEIQQIPADLFKTGSHTTTDITEGSKLFYTDARVKTKLSAEGVLSGSSQVIYGQLSGIPADIFLTGSHSTSNITEGSNLFFTDARVKTVLNTQTVISGSSQVLYSGITGVPADLFKTGSHTTTDITEGSNLFYTDTRVKTKLNTENVISSSVQVTYSGLSGVPADIFRTGSHSTTDITEGSKLFFTAARVKAELNTNTVISGSSQVLYSGITGVPADLFKTGSHSTTDITEGSKLFYTDARVKTKLNAEGVISSSAQVTIAANQVTQGNFSNGTYAFPSASLGINLSTPQANLHVSGTSRVDGFLAVRNIQSVTGNLLEVQNSTGTALASVSSSGEISAPKFTEGGQSLSAKYVSSLGGTINGSLVVTGTLTAAQFNTTLVSSSIIYQSGSTKFGDTSDDVMSVTGSLMVSGAVVVVGGITGNITTATTASYALAVSYANVQNKPTLISSSAQVDFGTISNKPTLFSGSAQVLYSGITGVPADIFRTGSHSTTDITEGTKLFYTDARVKTKLNTEGVVSSSAQVSYSGLSGVPADIFRTGSHSTTDITEGTKLFFTSARVKTELNTNTVISSSAQVAYASISGVPGDLFRTGSHTSDSITEGSSKLFYTDARVKTKLNTEGVVSSSSQVTYSGLSGIPADIFKTGSHTTTDITEGSKLFFTSARVKTELNTNTVISSSAQVAYASISGVPGDLFRTGSHSTTDITEGTKLFYTDARVKTKLNTETVVSGAAQVRSFFSASGIIAYDQNTGIFSATGGGSGTVTSVGLFAGAGILVSGSTINTSGSFLLTNTGVLSVAGRSGSVTLTAADVGAGTFPAGDYVVNGTLTANSLVETSTLRKKTDVVLMASQIELVKKLRPSEFTMKDTGRREKGLIAEEVAEVYPEFVAFEEIDGKLVPAGVNYSKMVSILINTVQELEARVVELEKKKTLWTRIRDLFS